MPRLTTPAWKSRFRYWLSSSEVAEVNRRNEYFRAPDLEADQIQTYFRRPLPGEAAVFITTAQIISRISGGIRQLMSPAKVNQLMKKLGFEAVRSGNKRGYLVVELTLDQVNQNRSAWGITCGKNAVRSHNHNRSHSRNHSPCHSHTWLRSRNRNCSCVCSCRYR